MRRRRNEARALTAEQLTDLYRAEQAAHSGSSPEVRRYAIRAALAEFGYTPLDAIRAGYWLRRGKPADYWWSEPDRPQQAVYDTSHLNTYDNPAGRGGPHD